VRIFLDASVVLAACGRPAGSSRAIFDFAPRNGWHLLTSRYVLNEVARNLKKLQTTAYTDINSEELKRRRRRGKPRRDWMSLRLD
jgi:predicted nucleic acid-binding protein